MLRRLVIHVMFQNRRVGSLTYVRRPVSECGKLENKQMRSLDSLKPPQSSCFVGKFLLPWAKLLSSLQSFLWSSMSSLQFDHPIIQTQFILHFPVETLWSLGNYKMGSEIRLSLYSSCSTAGYSLVPFKGICYREAIDWYSKGWGCCPLVLIMEESEPAFRHCTFLTEPPGTPG